MSIGFYKSLLGSLFIYLSIITPSYLRLIFRVKLVVAYI